MKYIRANRGEKPPEYKAEPEPEYKAEPEPQAKAPSKRRSRKKKGDS